MVPKFTVKSKVNRYQTPRGEPIREADFIPSRANENFSVDDIERIVNKIIMANPDREYRVSILVNDIGWRNNEDWLSRSRPLCLQWLHTNYYGDTALEKDFDSARQFILFSRPRYQPAGGCNKDHLNANDCLWRSLSAIFNGHLPPKIASDKAFRTAIGAPESGLIPASVELFNRVVSVLPGGVQLVISGEFTYASKPAARIVNIALHNSHYAPKCNSGRDKTYRCIFPGVVADKPVYFMVRDTDADTVSLYQTNSSQRAADIPPIIFTSEEYRLRCSEFRIRKLRPGMTLENEMRTHDVARVAFLQEFSLDIDHFRSLKDYALELWRLMSRSIPASKPISPVEESIIEADMIGGLVYGLPYCGEGVGLDVNSMYPYILTSDKLTLPMSEGALEMLDSIPDVVSYGFYRVKFERQHPLLRGCNLKFAWATHFDIQAARLLGIAVEIAHDGNCNAMLYKSGRIIANQIFGHYNLSATTEKTKLCGFVPRLYELKRRGGDIGSYAKTMLNILWGSLCERNRKKIFATSNPSELITIPDKVDRMTPYGNGQMLIRCRESTDREFIYNEARWCPFILAFARLRMTEMLIPHIDRLVRIHTDGFILRGVDIPADLQKRIGTALGDLKKEHQGNVRIMHVNSIKWD